MTKVTEYGRQWDARTPRGDISWLAKRWHVGMSDDEVTADIRKRCDGAEGFTADIIAESVAYALICHHANRELFRKVQSGNFEE